ncbi:pseudouridine 5'-phosphatase [Malassezia equina]|uniref:Pseudouridine 5'-phosphatase n=1 Tax=Malassezia equina TaxID=1381935 RepID=A0AAF0J3T6_9BASI|nr:pseudouridine 5'-phosphatase [Malassezia equina]
MAVEPLGRIRAVLFDMDGLLIDSERIYTDVVNEVLKPYGKEQTWDIKSKLMGQPERAATCMYLPLTTVVLLSSLWPPHPDSEEDKQRGFGSECPFTIDEFLKARNDRLLPAFEQVQPMPGAELEIKSSANTRLFAPFGERVICGDDATIERGKPFPDIFLTAARHGLGLQHTDEGRAWLEGVREPGANADHELKGAEGEILVFEDALPGVQAGLAAGMKVVWVPDPNLVAVTREGSSVGAHQELKSLLDFRPELWGLPPFEDP